MRVNDERVKEAEKKYNLPDQSSHGFYEARALVLDLLSDREKYAWLRQAAEEHNCRDSRADLDDALRALNEEE